MGREGGQVVWWEVVAFGGSVIVVLVGGSYLFWSGMADILRRLP